MQGSVAIFETLALGSSSARGVAPKARKPDARPHAQVDFGVRPTKSREPVKPAA